jgi:hypothetical protein
MVDTFALVGAVLQMKVKSYFVLGRQRHLFCIHMLTRSSPSPRFPYRYRRPAAERFVVRSAPFQITSALGL